MTIALDIDGVITDVDAFKKEEGKIFFAKDVVNDSGDDIDTIFDVSREEKQRFWIEKYKDYIINAQARPSAAEITHKLAELGHRVIIVTARKFNEIYGFSSQKEFEESTRQNLIENGIHFEEIYFEPRPKIPAVEKYGIDFFIEDDPVNIEALAKHTKIIIMDTTYNRDIDAPNTYRAYCWNDIIDIIENNK